MKMLLTGLVAALMTSAAIAQTITPAEPAAPAAVESAPAATEAAAPAAPAVEAAPAVTASNATTLVERDGKWWNGDRRATRAEIAALKKAQKAGVKG